MNCTHCLQEVLVLHLPFCENCGQKWDGDRSVALDGEPDTSTATIDEGKDLGRMALICLCGEGRFDSEDICDGCGRKASNSDVAQCVAFGDRLAGASDRGRKHAENQDAMNMTELPNGSVIMAVADGVSTACRAQEAAMLAVNVALGKLSEHQDIVPIDRMKLALVCAHAAICKLPYDDPKLAEPQATLVVALRQESHVWVGWVGDSRAYLCSSGDARQLTEDDSWLNEQVSAGVPLADALNDANAHCITQCLGMRDDDPLVHVAQFEMRAGDALLLCSDGLWNYANTTEILTAELAAAGPSATLVERCQHLVGFANARGGQDNITVALHSV